MSDEKRMWTVVRKMPPPFTVADLEQLSEVPGHEAELFLTSLEDAGYVTRRGEGFVLAKDTGPEPPELFHVHALEDGNTGEILPCGEESRDGVGRILRGLENVEKIVVGKGVQLPTSPLLPGKLRQIACNVLDPVIVFLDGARTFSLEDAVQDMGLERKQVLRVLEKLVREGRLELVKDARKAKTGFRKSMGPALRNPKYCVVKDAPPRSNRQPQKETVRDKLWRRIRSLRRFTRNDLAEAAGCAPTAAEDFCKLLLRHGFIRQTDEFENRRRVLVLVNDPGSARPSTPEIPRRKPC